MGRQCSKPDEATSLSEALYKARDRDAYFDRFSSDGESLDSEGSDDPLKHAGTYSTQELVSESINRWKKYLAICNQALGQLRHEMALDYHDMLHHDDCDIRGPDSENPIVLNSTRLPAEMKAYKKFLRVPKKETMHANNAMLQKFMTNYKPIRPSGYCQHPVVKTGSAKDRCNELVLPSTNYCLRHLVARTDSKAVVGTPCASGIGGASGPSTGATTGLSTAASIVAASDKVPDQVLFRRCGGGLDRKCAEIVVKWHTDSRCSLHTGFEDTLFDPVVKPENKVILCDLEQAMTQASAASTSTGAIVSSTVTSSGHPRGSIPSFLSPIKLESLLSPNKSS